jgi:hypothetical protein
MDFLFLCFPSFLVRLYIVIRIITYLQGVVTVQHGAAVVETVTDPPPRKKFLKIFILIPRVVDTSIVVMRSRSGSGSQFLF